MVAKPHCLMVSRLLVSARVYRLASIVNLCAPCAKLQLSKIPACVGRGNVAYYFRLASQRRDNRLSARMLAKKSSRRRVWEYDERN